MGRKVKEYMALKRAIFQELSEWVKQQLWVKQWELEENPETDNKETVGLKRAFKCTVNRRIDSRLIGPDIEGKKV
jgi:hypothetical protein